MKKDKPKISVENRKFDYSILYQDENTPLIVSPLHYHRYTEFVLCVEEGTEFTVNSKNIRLSHKDILVIGANVIHSSNKYDKNHGKQFVFRITPDFFSNLNNNLEYKKSISKFESLFTPYNYHIIKNEQLSDEFHEILSNIYNAEQDSGNNTLYLYSQFLMIAHIFLKHQNSIPLKQQNVTKGNEANIWATVDYMQQHFEEKITLEDMAKMAHMSYSYYPKIFKKTIGMTFSNFLISLRMSAAESLMLTNKYSMNEIAEKVGFPDQSAFNHTYKKLRGFSPRDFRKN